MGGLNDGKRKCDLTDNNNASMTCGKRQRLDSDEIVANGHDIVCKNDESSSNQRSSDDYTVGWICALPIEMAATQAMLDNTHADLPRRFNDSNTYTLGSIGRHNIVIACLPEGGYGTNNAASVASNMRRTFPFVRAYLMVGIGGAAPGRVDVRLGDVVVSNSVVQSDLGKTMKDGQFQQTAIPIKPAPELLTAVAKLRARHEQHNSNNLANTLSEMLSRHPSMQGYTHNDSLEDLLFDSNYDHDGQSDSCEYCDRSRTIPRSARSHPVPVVHYGRVASANTVMKDGRTRDRLARELDVVCFEMEAAGLIENFHCLVIRGICDYSDSHKNKNWQRYAAAVAAAYAKDFLSAIPIAEPPGRGQPPSRDHRSALMKCLQFERMSSRHSNIKPAHLKTCEWLLQHHDYLAWKDPEEFSNHRGFLWINGKPGAGKSTLMKFIYTRVEVEASSNAAIVSFFFNARGDSLEKSTMGMYRSLLFQILAKLPDLQKVLDSLDLFSCQNLDTRGLRDLLSDAVSRLGQRQLTVFVDALDECDEQEVREMVESFEELAHKAVSTGTKLCVCFSSRPYPHIDIEHGRKLTLQDQVGHGEDLAHYVRSKLRVGQEAYIREIGTEILQKAAGVFMWVVLVVDILNKEFQRGRIFAVRTRLQDIPPKLSELFKDMLTRDNDNMADLLLCIQWILYARRPLKPAEFYFAVISGFHHEREDWAECDPTQISIDDMERFVLSTSKGIAEVNWPGNNTSEWAKSPDALIVQFIHESVQDFLIKENGIREIWPNIGGDLRSSSHDQLKRCCYAYMSIDVFRHIPLRDKALAEAVRSTGQRLRQRFPFLDYAVQYVIYHSDRAATALPQNDFLKGLDLKVWIDLDNIFEPYDSRHYARNTVEPAKDTNILSNVSYREALSKAVFKGNVTIVKMLLVELGADANGTPGRDESLFLLATFNGRTAALEALLDCPYVDPNIRGPFGRAALALAAEMGNAVIAELLLRRKDVEVNMKDQTGMTPLSIAAGRGHRAVVEELLKSTNVAIDVTDSRQRTPLMRAAVYNHVSVVSLMLQRLDINLDLEDEDGWTALSIAAGRGHVEVVELLLKRGARADIEDLYGDTALDIAKTYRRRKVVHLLLNWPGQVYAEDCLGQEQPGR